MAQTAGGTYYAASSELVSSWPATSLDLANQLESRFAAKASLSGATYTGTHNFSSATVTGIASGLALISPTSIANSGGSASASGGAVTFTTVNSVSLNGVFSSTYDHYLVRFLADCGSSAVPRFRLRASGSDTATNYTMRYIRQTAATTLDANSSGSATVLFDTGSAFAGRWQGEFTLFGPNIAQETRAHGSYSAVSNQYWGLLYSGQTDSTQFDGLTLIPSGGTVSGVLRVYGYRN